MRFPFFLFGVLISCSILAQEGKTESGFFICGKSHKIVKRKIHLSDGYLHLGDNIHSFFFNDGSLLEGTWNEGKIDSIAGYYDSTGSRQTRFSKEHEKDFTEMISNSELPDKMLIVRIMQMIADPEQRVKEFKNLSKTYSFMQKNELGVFSNGLALIYSDGKYGFVNRCMEIVIPPKYENAGGFVKEYALVKEGEKWIKIDQEGKPLE